VSQLRPIFRFNTQGDFQATEKRLQQMVESGELENCGEDPHERSRLVEIFRTKDGEFWLLAHPDHAFRGFLRKKDYELLPSS
jgi:hypothetical protein